MNIFKYKKIFFLIIFLTFFASLATKVSAANIIIKPSSENVGIGQQFYIDVILDTEGESFNGVEGSIYFSPDTTFLVRIEDGKSMFNTWIQKPVIESNKISFSGISPNGFDGVIDPFNPKDKLPGPVIRIIFQGLKPGKLDFSTSQFYITKNDNLGTIEQIEPQHLSVIMDNYENNFIMSNKNDLHPEIDTQVIKDENLFNNKYTLIFKATDKGSGIKSVMIKEGSRDWKEVASPYLLEDQTRHSIINIRAVNYSGSSIITSIDALPYNLFSPPIILFIIIVLLIALFIYKKDYVNKKIKSL